MAEIVLRDRSGADGIVRPGRFGRMTGPVGVVATERRDLCLATVMVRRNRENDLAAAVRSVFGLELPPPGHAALGPKLDLVCCGSGEWLALSADTSDIEPHLRAALGWYAAIADQSDGRVVLRLSGPRVRDTLAKGLVLDLHPRVFRAGAAAVTVVAHTRIEFWQEHDLPIYSLAVPRTPFASFWSWLVASAAEFGMDVVDRE